MSNEVFDRILSNEQKIKLNDEQKKVVYSDKNTVVSAGAGSGKTTVLAYRYLRLITSGIKVDEILTITFTKKATTEMHERIQKLLVKYMNDDESIQNALKDFSVAQISTLDSFYSSIVTLGAQHYGLSKDFSIMSGSEEVQIAQKIGKNYLLKNEDRFQFLLDNLGDINAIFPGYFIEIANKSSLLSKIDVEESMNSYLDLVDRTLDEEIALRRENAKIIIAEADDAKTIAKAEEILAAIDEGKFFDIYQDITLKKSAKQSEEANNAKYIFQKSGKDRIKFLLTLKEDREKQKQFLQIIREVIELINKEKRRLSKLTFNDVGIIALDILKKNEAIRTFFKKKFKKIMIDEFQDNNLLTKEILYLISEKENANSFKNEVPKANDLTEDKLFFVGDEKQSIYKFRGADVSAFKSLQSELTDAGGEALSLVKNYRSEPRLIEHFNEVFTNLFSHDDENIHEARHQEVEAREKKEGITPQIKMYIGDNILSKISADKQEVAKYDMEASFIAKLIKEMVSSEEYEVPDKKGGKRLARYSDIAILYRSRTSLPNIERALRNNDIPYVMSETKSIMSEAVSYDFYDLLRLATKRDDRKAYLSVLRGPFSRISDESLLKIMEYPIFFADIDFENQDDRQKYETIRNNYLCLSQKINNGESITNLIDYIYYECGYYSYLTLNNFYINFREHYEYLWALAEKSVREGQTLSDFLLMLRENLGHEETLQDIELLPDTADGVNITTIYKSKGLEYPIVILTNITSPGKSNPHASNNIYTDDNIIFSNHNSIDTLNDALEKTKKAAELKRLLYVALTRAETHLVLTGVYSLTKNGEFANINNTLFNLYTSGIQFEGDTETKRFSSKSKSEIVYMNLENKRFIREDIKDNTNLTSWYEEAEKDLTFNKHRISVTSLEQNTEEIIPTYQFKSYPFDEVIQKHSIAADFGTLAHSACELIMQDRLDELVFNKFKSEKDNKTLLEGAKELAQNLMQSEYFQKLTNLGKCENEVRFYSYIDDQALEGVMDLLILGEKFNLVVDFKTDRAMNKEAHKTQLTQYSKIAREIYKKPCYSTVIYLREVRQEDIWDEDGNVINLE